MWCLHADVLRVTFKHKKCTTAQVHTLILATAGRAQLEPKQLHTDCILTIYELHLIACI
jgi:hypothetical protein